MTEARWPTDADVARMREVYFAEGPRVSDVAIRIILEMLAPGDARAGLGKGAA